MKKIEYYIITIIFVLGIGFYSVMSVINAKDELAHFSRKLKISSFEDCSDAISGFDDIFTENVYMRYPMIEAYGAVNKALGKKEINGFEYVVDKNGYLSMGNFWNVVYDRDEKALALNTELFRELLAEKDIPLVFVAYPQKVNEQWTEGYSGLPYDDYSYEMNQYLIQMRRYRIPHVDLNREILQSGCEYGELFYKTDHHWTSKGAFIGFTKVVDCIEELGLEIDPEDKYTDLSNYTIEQYPGMMLGSSGRSVGLIYAGGAEDFELYYLDEGQDYELTFGSGSNIERMYGRLSEVILDKEVIEKINKNFDKNIYRLNMYDIYMHGIRAEASINNLSNQDGPSVLFLTDSYGMPIATWMAPMFSKIDVLWIRDFTTEEIQEFLDENEYDLVMIGLYPNDMSDEFIHFPEIERPEEELEEITEDETNPDMPVEGVEE